jgi:hypothetical protein
MQARNHYIEALLLALGLGFVGCTGGGEDAVSPPSAIAPSETTHVQADTQVIEKPVRPQTGIRAVESHLRHAAAVRAADTLGRWKARETHRYYTLIRAKNGHFMKVRNPQADNYVMRVTAVDSATANWSFVARGSPMNHTFGITGRGRLNVYHTIDTVCSLPPAGS